MVVAEVLTGIALVQQSVKFIKDNISTAQDIGQIASQIDDLFAGEKQVQQARAKKSGSGLGDQFGVDTVAKRKKIQKDREFEEMMKQAVLVGTIIVIAVGLFIFLMVSVAKAIVI